MYDNVRREIEQEKEWMERDIKKVENYNPQKPDEPSLSKTFIPALKVLGVAFAIAAVNFLFALSAENYSGAEKFFIFITAVATLFGLIAAPLTIWSNYSSDRDALEKWKTETSAHHKQEEIGKIKRKYETRINNLERYGSIKGSYSCWHKPPKVCLKCGSTNVKYEELGGSLSRSVKQTCQDCGYIEVYW